MKQMLLVNLDPILGIVYLTEIRSRARRGRRFRVKRGSSERTAAPDYQVISVVTILSVIALVVASDGRLATQRGITNCVAVVMVILLVQAVGAFVHNRTRARR